MEHSQVIPIIRNQGGSAGAPAGQWSEPQKTAAWPESTDNTNKVMAVSVGQPWLGMDGNNIINPAVAPLQPMSMDFNEQMRQMQENMQRWQEQWQANFMGGMGPPPMTNLAPAPFPQMGPIQPFPSLPAQDTRPAIDPQGFFRLTPLPSLGMSTPLDIPDVVVQCKDGSKKFLLKYDVSDFKPGEVKVEVNGNQLKVSGNHEEISGNSVIKRTYHKEHPLPDGLRQDQLRSVLSPEGILTIQAPVVGDVPVGPQPTPMVGYEPTAHLAPAPAVTMHSYHPQVSATLPRAEKRRVKFCEGDP